MKDLLALLAKRAPLPVAIALLAILGYLMFADEAARHAVLMSLATVSTDMDWSMSALIGVLAWIGNRVHVRLDELTREVKGLHSTLTEFDRDLREDIQSTKEMAVSQYNVLADRVTLVEERCDRMDAFRAATCPHHKADGA